MIGFIFWICRFDFQCAPDRATRHLFGNSIVNPAQWGGWFAHQSQHCLHDNECRSGVVLGSIDQFFFRNSKAPGGSRFECVSIEAELSSQASMRAAAFPRNTQPVTDTSRHFVTTIAPALSAFMKESAIEKLLTSFRTIAGRFFMRVNACQSVSSSETFGFAKLQTPLILRVHGNENRRQKITHSRHARGGRPARGQTHCRSLPGFSYQETTRFCCEIQNAPRL